MYVITHIINDNEVYTYKYNRFRDFRIRLQEIKSRFPRSRTRYYTNQVLSPEVVISSYSSKF